MLGNDYKHPVVLAREVATLDLLSDGRLELGIGAGWMTVDYEKAGIPLDRPGVRIARLAESITVLKGLFADGPFTLPRRALPGRPSSTVSRSRCSGRTRRSSSAAAAPKILALAAREAQDRRHQREPARRATATHPDAAQSLTAAATDQKLAWLRDAAGDRFDDLEIQTLAGFVHVTDDPRRSPTAMAPLVRRRRPRTRARAPAALVGTVERDRRRCSKRRRERWQMSYIVVPDRVDRRRSRRSSPASPGT